MGRPNQDFPGKPSFLDGIIFEEKADEVWICKEQIDTAKLPKLILHAKTKTCGTEEEQKRRDRDVILRPSEANYARGLAAHGGLGDRCATRVEVGVG